ncbi:MULTISPECIES: RsmE family RNA methyltransferase [unclassified Campylobacter]|uniref:16S rRNA (uracil(1498)-N(3))-methyltransferase n=1 Tax=unclassified Campylobacter TaxID=2593542 RepID=UPI001BDAC5FE|nr:MULTISPECIES: RsmE family RNA methyltransferase [unclassified Campylobacter]MBZ7975565.1 16S rRNA (uracil(1498)-N(3))-methyltransferase [Campylobacter sp. RM12637]MBZ7977417.1 16S rRNA (uracil(1498)-N(3))-methyltransferase [Campylobacter sp. RM12654]MBZ7979394.1 16S rRNA (uracil(1498)-N(3))-methyltransferase [Campylobacter sp. RM12642]MBZ7981031.1 16S rRNA (uracil(1498)-N(3))-methyltransferase [Campylobacter sp. RM12640]MBZ7983258.1 16S rRNA (uracil(1498)-N(3))-methyltransferase [Campylobac
MFYYFNDLAGSEEIVLDSELVSHFKARREQIGNIVNISRLDGFLYKYEIIFMQRNKIILKMLEQCEFKANKSGVKIALAMIEIDSIFEIAPYLNELGLEELFLVYTDFSQKSYKFDDKKLAKLEKILHNSSSQCARADILKITILNNLAELKKLYNDFVLIDFNKNDLCEFNKDCLYVIGPEGGFSEKERNLFKTQGLKITNILKAKTAIISISSKILM